MAGELWPLASAPLLSPALHFLAPHTVPCVSVPCSIPTMLAVHSEQLHKTGYPTVHAVVLLEGTMNLTGETQPLVEQLMMVKRMQVGAQSGCSAHMAAWPRGVVGGFFWYFLGERGILLIRSGKWIPVMQGGAISHVPASHLSCTVSELARPPPPSPHPGTFKRCRGMGTLLGFTLRSSHSIFPPHFLSWRSGKLASWGLSSLPRVRRSSSGQLSPSSRYPGHGSNRAPSLAMVLKKSSDTQDLCPAFLPTGIVRSLPGPPAQVPIESFL